jgi:hypothetical protein
MESMAEPVLHPLNQSQDAALYNSMMLRSMQPAKNMDVTFSRREGHGYVESGSSSSMSYLDGAGRSITSGRMDMTTEYDERPFHLSDLQDTKCGDEGDSSWIISPRAGRYMRAAVGSLKGKGCSGEGKQEAEEADPVEARRQSARNMMRVAVDLLNSEYGVAATKKTENSSPMGSPDKRTKEDDSSDSDSVPLGPPPLDEVVSHALGAYALSREKVSSSCTNDDEEEGGSTDNSHSFVGHRAEEDDGDVSPAKALTPTSSSKRVISKSQSLPTARTPLYDMDGRRVGRRSPSPTNRTSRGSYRQRTNGDVRSEGIKTMDEKMVNKVPSFTRKSRKSNRTFEPPAGRSIAHTPCKETDLTALSNRLNIVADRAVAESLGEQHLGKSTPEVKMLRQEAVIAELLSILLQSGDNSTGNHTPVVGAHDASNATPHTKSDYSDLENVSLDDVMFLLKEQQQELKEIRQISQKQKNDMAYDFDPFGSGERVSGFFDDVHRSPISPIMARDEEARGRSVRTSLASSARKATPSPDTRMVGGPGGRSRPHSESPVRNGSSSKWIGGGTSSSHHIQAQDSSRFDYPPVNALLLLSDQRGRSLSPGRIRSSEAVQRHARSRSGSLGSSSGREVEKMTPRIGMV